MHVKKYVLFPMKDARLGKLHFQDSKHFLYLIIGNCITKYQPSGEGGTRSPLVTPNRLQNSKFQNGCGSMERGLSLGFWALQTIFSK